MAKTATDPAVKHRRLVLRTNVPLNGRQTESRARSEVFILLHLAQGHHCGGPARACSCLLWAVVHGYRSVARIACP
jgi:hypothetical protein